MNRAGRSHSNTTSSLTARRHAGTGTQNARNLRNQRRHRQGTRSSKRTTTSTARKDRNLGNHVSHQGGRHSLSSINTLLTVGTMSTNRSSHQNGSTNGQYRCILGNAQSRFLGKQRTFTDRRNFDTIHGHLLNRLAAGPQDDYFHVWHSVLARYKIRIIPSLRVMLGVVLVLGGGFLLSSCSSTRVARFHES